jgi:hypothetical protein
MYCHHSGERKVSDMIRRFLAFTVAALSPSGAAVQAADYNLQDLIDGQIAYVFKDGVAVKALTDFTYDTVVGGGGAAADASAITISTNEVGWTAFVNSGIVLTAGSGAFADAIFGYTVTALVGNPIDEVSLGFVGGTAGTGVATIAENVYDVANVLLGTLFVSSPFGPPTDIEFSNPPQTSVRVIKDINVTGGSNGVGTISLIIQDYNQVPEPGSLALIGMGLAGLVGYRWRRRLIASA